MKWRLERWLGGRGLYVLLTVAALGLLLGASFKWRP